MMKNVQQLNEEFKQLLEISDDLANKVADARKQNVLDAAKKYAKNQELMDKRNGEQPEEESEEPGYVEHTKNELQNVINGTYEGDMADAVVLENLEEIEMDDLIRILEDYTLYRQGIHRLYPSYWRRNIQQPYPVKLAQAIASSTENESLSDVYNIFYCHANVADFKDAMKVWQDDILNNWYVTSDLIGNMTDGGDVSQLADLFSVLQQNCPKFAHQFLNKLEENDEETFDKLMDTL